MAATGQFFQIVRIPLSDTGLVITLSLREDGVLARMWRGGNKFSASRMERVQQRYYAEAARELNRMAVEEFHREAKRPGVSTGRLAAALSDPRNTYVGTRGFGAGVPTFLDRSQAQYWRQIEEGTSVHVGQRLWGLWGSSLSGGWATSNRGNRYALAGPTYSVHGHGGQESKFQPLSTFTGKRSSIEGLKARHPGTTKRRGAKATNSAVFGARIHNSIEANDYYGRAFERFRRTNRPLNLLRAVLAEEMGIGRRSVPRSWAALSDWV